MKIGILTALTSATVLAGLAIIAATKHQWAVAMPALTAAYWALTAAHERSKNA